jgi:L-lactate permease
MQTDGFVKVVNSIYDIMNDNVIQAFIAGFLFGFCIDFLKSYGKKFLDNCFKKEK